jgi:hypothetical protein
MRRFYLCCCLAAVSLAVVAPHSVDAAEGLDYTYLELAYVGRDIDAFDDDEDVIEDLDDGGGVALEGSLALGDNFFIFGGYSDTESDVTFVNDEVFPLPAETDIKRLDLGVGTMVEINDRLDFVGRLGYVDIDFGDFDFGASEDIDANDLLDDSSDGYLIDIGLRSQLLTNLEGSIGVRHIDVEDIDNTSLLASLLFELSPSWDIGVSIDAGDDVSTYMLGVRFSPSP